MEEYIYKACFYIWISWLAKRLSFARAGVGEGANPQTEIECVSARRERREMKHHLNFKFQRILTLRKEQQSQLLIPTVTSISEIMCLFNVEF